MFWHLFLPCMVALHVGPLGGWGETTKRPKTRYLTRPWAKGPAHYIMTLIGKIGPQVTKTGLNIYCTNPKKSL